MQFKSFRYCDCSKLYDSSVYCVWSRAFALSLLFFYHFKHYNARSHFNKQKQYYFSCCIIHSIHFLFLAKCNYHLWFEWIFDWQWWKYYFFNTKKVGIWIARTRMENKIEKSNNTWAVVDMNSLSQSHIAPCRLLIVGMCIANWHAAYFIFLFYLTKNNNNIWTCDIINCVKILQWSEVDFKISFFCHVYIYFWNSWGFFTKF